MISRPLIISALLVGLTACGSNADDASDTTPVESSAPSTAESPMPAVEPVTLVLDWTPNTNHGGIYLADQRGWYEEVGIDLDIIQPGDTGSLQALASGNAEFGISVQEQLVPARAAGVPVVSIAAIVENNTSSMMALTASGIERPADFAGHRYGGWGGQLETELIDRLVECDGGDPTAVDTVEVGNTDYRVGLERGAFDFVWVYEGWDKIRLEQEGVDITTLPFIDYEDCIPNWYTPLIATSESMIESDPELVTRFLTATARGYREAIADPPAAADALLAGAPELDPELVRASAQYLAGQYASDPDAWGHQRDEVWTGFVGFLVDAGLLEETIDIPAAYSNAFLP